MANDSVLVVAAHPDDEVLGMAGTIKRLVEQGASVQVLFLTNGVGARGSDADAIQERQHAAERASQLLGYRIHAIHNLPDNGLDNLPLLTVVQLVESAIAALNPRTVYTHHPGDLNIDHRIAFQATLTACRPQPGCVVQQIMAFSVASSTEWSHPALGGAFIPDTWVDVTQQMPAILNAYDCYALEQRPDPHARSRQSLELKLGHTGRQVGLKAAEAFSTIRRILTQSQSSHGPHDWTQG